MFVRALFIIFISFSAYCATAQEYPNKPIKIMVGFAVGGAADLLARTIADEMRIVYGQTVIVENRAGAAGVIAANLVARSPADGYTLLLCNVGSVAIDVHLDPKPPYDTLRDFAPVSLLVINDGVILVSKNFPAKTFPEFISVIKNAPGKYQYGSSGVGGPLHLAGQLLKLVAGLDIGYVPYKGDSQHTADLIGGHLPISMPVMASVSAHVKSGQVRAIAAMGEKRFSDFPDLPTISESGYPGFTAGSWLAILAPIGTPPDIVQKLNVTIRQIMAKPSIVKSLNDTGSRIATGTPDEFGKFLSAEITKWGDVIKRANIKREQ